MNGLEIQKCFEKRLHHILSLTFLWSFSLQDFSNPSWFGSHKHQILYLLSSVKLQLSAETLFFLLPLLSLLPLYPILPLPSELLCPQGKMSKANVKFISCPSLLGIVAPEALPVLIALQCLPMVVLCILSKLYSYFWQNSLFSHDHNQKFFSIIPKFHSFSLISSFSEGDLITIFRDKRI